MICSSWSRFAAAAVVLAGMGAATPLLAQVTTNYTYDEQGQVTGAARSNANPITYSYDAAGNRVALSVSYPAPGAGAGSLSVPFGGSASLALPVSGQATGAAIDAAPAKGSVSISGTTATYTASGSNYGADNFTYHATGPGGNSPVQTISVTIANPPAPGAISTSTAYNTAKAIALSPSGVYTSLAVAAGPSHGSASISGTTATYTPAGGYFGPDSFTYVAAGPGGTSAPATVSVTVAAPPTNTPPTAVNDGAIQLIAGDTVGVNVVANDSDPDGDPLTVIGLSKTTSARVDYQFSGGVITVTAKSSKGGDTVTYTVSDGRGGTATATLSIFVNY